MKLGNIQSLLYVFVLFFDLDGAEELTNGNVLVT